MNKKFLIVFVIILFLVILFGTVFIYKIDKNGGEQIAEEDNSIITELDENANTFEENEKQSETPEENDNKEDDYSNLPTSVEPITTTKTTTSNTQSSKKTNETKKDTPITEQTVITQEEPNKNNEIQEQKEETQTTKENTQTNNSLQCNNGKHFMDVGNVGKWFDTKAEAINYYNTLIQNLSEEWTKPDSKMTDEEYYSKCPYRYEVWGCICGKYTLDFYYR